MIRGTSEPTKPPRSEFLDATHSNRPDGGPAPDTETSFDDHPGAALPGGANAGAEAARPEDAPAWSAATAASTGGSAGAGGSAPAGDLGAAPSAPSAPDGPAPGLRAQFGATRRAVGHLVSSHIELAKAEFADILDEVKRVAVLAGMAIGALIVVGFLVPIGLSLFVGETLFGSMGWGILHGSLLFTGIAIGALLVALGVGGGTVGRDFLIAAVVGMVVGVVLGLDLTNRGWAAAGNAVAGNLNADIRPFVIGAAVLAILGAILGLVLGGRGGGMGGAIVGGIGGAILGALVGILTAIALGPRVGAAIGVAVGLTAWPVLMGMGVARRGIDTEALRARFWPDETIETTKETIEWVRARTPLGPRS